MRGGAPASRSCRRNLWDFPAGLPHSLQGLGSEGAEFVLAFGNGHPSQFITLLLTGWMAHTLPDVLAANLQGEVPGSLAADRQATRATGGQQSTMFRLSATPLVKQTRGGRVQTIDFRAGDVGCVKKSLGHSIQNTGSTQRQSTEIFKVGASSRCRCPTG